MSERKWWESAIVYQIYPRSFFDSNQDGIGDINGMYEKLDYIEALGVNTLWVNPVIESAQRDNGYDVTNYYEMDPIFGTKEEGLAFLEEAHKRGLKVLFDFPLNHTSIDHPWFQAALQGKDNPYRDYYIWADAPEGREFPNNWSSQLGGSAWTKEPDGDQFYLHLFKETMADLNWNNPEVQEEMFQVAKYWTEKGIDGFRLDAFIFASKAKGLPDNPDADDGEFASGSEMNAYNPGLSDYLQEFNRVIHQENKDMFVVGEAVTADVEIAENYILSEKEMVDKIITFTYFPEREDLKDDGLPLDKQIGRLDIPKFKNIMSDFQEFLGGKGGPILYWNNHDMARVVSRFGDEGAYRNNSAKMLATLMYLQKGIPFIYYGEELGMKNLVFDSVEDFEGPGEPDFVNKAREAGYSDEEILKHLNFKGRNLSRGIMQWDDSKYAGFSSVEPWMKWHEEPTYNVRVEESDEQSILAYYRRLLEHKKTPLFTEGSFRLIDTKDTLYVYERSYENQRALIYCNFSDQEERMSVSELADQEWTTLLENDGNRLKEGELLLAPYGAVVYVKEEDKND